MTLSKTIRVYRHTEQMTGTSEFITTNFDIVVNVVVVNVAIISITISISILISVSGSVSVSVGVSVSVSIIIVVVIIVVIMILLRYDLHDLHWQIEQGAFTASAKADMPGCAGSCHPGCVQPLLRCCCCCRTGHRNSSSACPQTPHEQS